MRHTGLSAILLCGCFSDPGLVEGSPAGTSGGSSSGAVEADGPSGPSGVTTASSAVPDASSTSTSATTQGLLESSSSSSGDASSSSTGTPQAFYAHCTEADDSACAENEDCIWTDGQVEGIAPAGFCSKGCNEPADCPDPPPESNAQVACTYYCDNVLRCMLRCPAGQTCPDGTLCVPEMQLPECGATYLDICV